MAKVTWVSLTKQSSDRDQSEDRFVRETRVTVTLQFLSWIRNSFLTKWRSSKWHFREIGGWNLRWMDNPLYKNLSQSDPINRLETIQNQQSIGNEDHHAHVRGCGCSWGNRALKWLLVILIYFYKEICFAKIQRGCRLISMAGPKDVTGKNYDDALLPTLRKILREIFFSGKYLFPILLILFSFMATNFIHTFFFFLIWFVPRVFLVWPVCNFAIVLNKYWPDFVEKFAWKKFFRQVV